MPIRNREEAVQMSVPIFSNDTNVLFDKLYPSPRTY